MANTNTVSFHDFDLAKRYDNSVAIYDYGWWPDAELDADPALNARYLNGTWGWRAKGWQVVHVTSTFAEAKGWIEEMMKRRSN